jgi:hypothetical protein
MMSTGQADSSATIQLPPPSTEQIAGFAVWRVDYYICTIIAYAKSLGKTVEELINYVGNAHDWEEMRGKGVVPPVRFLYFLIMNYKNGEFEILSQSDSSIQMRFNRPILRKRSHARRFGGGVREFSLGSHRHHGQAHRFEFYLPSGRRNHHGNTIPITCQIIG